MGENLKKLYSTNIHFSISNWSQTRFQMGKMPLGMKVVLSNLPFTNYLKLKFPKFVINKLQV